MSYVSDLNGSLKSLNDLYARLQDRARSSSGNNRTFNPHLVHGLYLHSNLLRTIEADVLGLFTSLTSLDLSSNLIECMKGLEATPGLVELNLSNNKIRRVEGLKSLYALRSLNLSFNQIKNLDGFQVIRGNRYSLEILDVKGNRIDDINTLDDLRGCTSLRHLVLHSESVISRVNPICASARYSPRMVFDVFPLLESVDGYSPSGLPVTVEPLLDGTSEYQEHASAATPEGFASGNIWDAPRGFPAEDDRTQYRDKQVLHLQNQVEALMASLDRRPTHLETKLSSDIAHLRSAYEEMRAFLRRDDPPKKGAQLREHNGAKPVSNANVDALARMEKQLAALSQIVAEKKSRTNGDEERRSGRQSPVGGGKARSGPKVTRTREKSPPVAVQSRKNATMATHRNANVENEDPDEQSSDGSDCTTSTKGRGVWPSARTEKSDSLIPKSRVSHGQKASTVSDATTKKKAAITLPANTKLISALEEEEKRLRANEVKYAEQIKALMEEVKTERELRSKAEAECGELKKELEPKKDAQNQMGILQEENAKLKAKAKESDQKMESLENVVKSQKVQIATMTNDVKILKADKTSLESQLASHKKKLDLAKDVVNDDKSALLNLEHQLQAAEESKSRLSMRLIKEREESKIRVAESNAELDVYKSTVKQLQKHLQSVQQQLANKESESGQRIRELSSTLNNELKTAISDTTKSLITKHRDEFDAVSKQLASTKHAYGVLEEEYRKRMREEQSRQSRLQAAYNEASERLAKTEKALDLATDKEKEMSCIIQELTLVVKEQKAKLAELEKQETLSFDVFEEKVRSLESQLKSAQQSRDDLTKAQSEWIAQRSAFEENIAKQNREITNLQQQIERITSQSETAVAASASHEQALRVKNKMLDDQMETIKSLKQNLDNKCREHQQLLADTEKRTDELEDRLEAEKAIRKDMQQEIESQNQLIDHLQTLVDDYKGERNALRKDLAEATKRLEERNESIHMIEEEVARIRKVLKTKEENWKQEKEDALKQMEHGYLEMRLNHEAQTSRLAALEREREVMLQSMQGLQKEVEAAAKQRKTHEEEMRMLLGELDRQKERMSAKMDRLRAAFTID